MRNGNINIKAFLLLDTIRDNYHILDGDWAKVTTLKYGARISELRAMATGKRQVLDRSFNYRKWISLLDGLETILGGDLVRKGLAEQLEKSTSLDEKNLLLLTAVPEERKSDLYNYLQLLVQAPPKKPKK